MNLLIQIWKICPGAQYKYVFRDDIFNNLASEGINQYMKEIHKLFSKPLTSTRSGAFYNTFPYPTKISPESIAVYIATATEPGDKILDTFGGSGSTGIATLLCEHPTDQMIKISKELGVNPKWGKRDAILYEIGSYGSFASNTIMSRLSARDFESALNDFINTAEEVVGYYYSTKDPNGHDGIMRYIIWTDVLTCPNCKKELSYFSEGTSRQPAEFKKEIKCPYCGCSQPVDEFSFAVEEYFDGLLNRTAIRKKRVPAWVYGSTDGENWNRKANIEDALQINIYEQEPHDKEDLPRKIQWGELHRAGYHFGITHLHHFYTRRNYNVMSKLWKITDRYEKPISDALKLLLLSYNATHCTLMTRVVAKKNAKDFILTGAQSGVLYISKLPVEKNILLGLRRKAKPFIEAFGILENCTGNVIVHNSSSEKILEPENSVDFIFTDPPFGDFIPYAEVNQINELWLEKVTDRTRELIISASQNKGVYEYKEMLKSVFSEINRVLRKEKYAAVVFHSAKANIWSAFGEALDSSGFGITLTNILEKKQASFKQVVSAGAVQGDPMFLLQKSEQMHCDTENGNQLLDEVIDEGRLQSQLNERRLYSLYVNKSLENGVPVTLDAKEAYEFIKRRLGENSFEKHK